MFLWASRTRVGAAKGDRIHLPRAAGPGPVLYWRDRKSSGVGGGMFCRLVWCLGGAVAIIPVPRTASVTVPGPALTGAGYDPCAPRHLYPWSGSCFGVGVGGLCVVLAVVGGRFCRNLRIRAGSTPFSSLCV